MIRVLIVDDDSLIHVTLRSLLVWENLGYTVVQDCSNGNQALSYLKNHTVDLLITDMKMPGMGGLELMQRLRQQGRMPVTIALSGYDEFELVREAFRLGAYDYLLKSDINSVGLENLLRSVRKKLFRDIPASGKDIAEPSETALPDGEYMAAVFQIQDFPGAARRFGDHLREGLEKPMLELANQIHRLQGRAVFRADDPGQYTMYYTVRDRKRARDTIVSVVNQVQSVWRDFMNLEVAVGVSDVAAREQLDSIHRRCETLAVLSTLQGKGRVSTQWEHGTLADIYEAEAEQCDCVIAALCGEDNDAAQKEIGRWLSGLKQCTELRSCERALVMLARMGDRLRQYGQDFYEIFPEKVDFFAALRSIETRQEREIWVRNILRRVQSACAESRQSRQLGTMERAKRFMQDNFNNPELSLRTVADYVGFNEKYFSTRFTKECGCTFITYLNDLRIRRAQELLVQTDMKMYEISEAVGYGSVEHFNHIFKKKMCISPKEYRQNQKNS